jgi:hypothetical protein
MVAKDNHIPLIEEPQDQNIFMPNSEKAILNDANLNQWQNLNQKNKNYSPGYPYGEPTYILSCKQPVSSY